MHSRSSLEAGRRRDTLLVSVDYFGDSIRLDKIVGKNLGHDSNDPAALLEEVRRLRQELSRHTPRLAALLRRRGFNIYKMEPGDDLLLPAPRYRRGFYEMMHKYSFRLFLRDVIKHQESFTLTQVAGYAGRDTARTYADYLSNIGLIKQGKSDYSLIAGRIRSFGETLEWYISELFEQEFGCEAVWGVKFKRPRVGGDYDVIAKVDGSILYMEVKSSPPKQIYDSEITAFMDRIDDLAPEIAVFFMDTELRMKDKIVPMFEKELASRYREPPLVKRIERELFEIEDRVFIINAKDSVAGNIEKVLYRYYRSRRQQHENRLFCSK